MTATLSHPTGPAQQHAGWCHHHVQAAPGEDTCFAAATFVAGDDLGAVEVDAAWCQGRDDDGPGHHWTGATVGLYFEDLGVGMDLTPDQAVAVAAALLNQARLAANPSGPPAPGRPSRGRARHCCPD